MKNIIYLIVGAFIFAACSAPKYAYHFDHYDYNSGRKTAKVEATTPSEVSPLIIDQQAVVADASPSTVIVSEEKTKLDAPTKKAIADRISNLSKTEKKELKQMIKEYRKQVKKSDSGKGVQDKKAWDHDLKMAVIFGAVAVVMSTLSGFSYVFWIIAVVALIIGLVFLIKWLSRQ